MSEGIDVRRHLNGPRRRVLDIVAALPGSRADEIASTWKVYEPSLSPRHVGALPRMVDQILWRLENLGWVERCDGGYCVTARGEAAKNFPLRDQ